jgi:hypothetical protein
LGFNIGVAVFGALTAAFTGLIYLGANAVSTITASLIASPVAVGMQTQAGGL